MRLLSIIASLILHVPAGSTIHHEGETAAHLELFVLGFVRVYASAPDGRTMTVRYCPPGALIGAASLFRTPFSLPATIQALVDSDLLAFRTVGVHRLLEHEPRLARALLRELSERVLSFIAEIPAGAFGSLRQRAARHLLDLAAQHQRGRELFAPVSQQGLADAVGTVREVIVRILRDFRTEGMVSTRRGGVIILEPERLLAATFPGEHGPSLGTGT
jgi:CRP/FNR family transcriptional regulator, cyclic AMP receptor protein